MTFKRSNTSVVIWCLVLLRLLIHERRLSEHHLVHHHLRRHSYVTCTHHWIHHLVHHLHILTLANEKCLYLLVKHLRRIALAKEGRSLGGVHHHLVHGASELGLLVLSEHGIHHRIARHLIHESAWHLIHHTRSEIVHLHHLRGIVLNQWRLIRNATL